MRSVHECLAQPWSCQTFLSFLFKLYFLQASLSKQLYLFRPSSSVTCTSTLDTWETVSKSPAATKHGVLYDSVRRSNQLASAARANRAAPGRWRTSLAHAQGGETLAKPTSRSAEVKAPSVGSALREDAELESCVLLLGQGEGAGPEAQGCGS